MKLNSSGQSLVEVMVCVGILSSTLYGVMTTTAILVNSEFETSRIANDNKVAQLFVSNITANPGIYQRNLSGSPAATILNTETLPLGYANNYIGPRAGCPGGVCLGYAGFTLQPSAGYPGLSKVTIRTFNIQKNETKDLVLTAYSN